MDGQSSPAGRARRPLAAWLMLLALLCCARSAYPQQENNKEGPHEPARVAKEPESSWEVKEDLYERFLTNYKADTWAAYLAGKEYLRIFEPVDGPNNAQVVYLKKWVGVFERLSQDPTKCGPVDINARLQSQRGDGQGADYFQA